MKETITRDDLTGSPSETTREVSIQFDDQTYTLDLESESATALTALFADRDSSKLRALLTTPVIATVEATRVTVKPKAKAKAPPADNKPTGKEVNAWLKSEGRESEVTRGNVAKELVDQYIAAHSGKR